MTNFDIAMSIWWRAILLNVLFTSTWAVFQAGTGVVALAFIMTILGYLITLPLLPVVTWIVMLMRMIPYGRKESFFWMNSMLVILVWAFYGLATLVTQSWPPDGKFFYLVAGTTSLAVLAAVQLTKKHIVNLPVTSSNEKHAQKKSLTYV